MARDTAQLGPEPVDIAVGARIRERRRKVGFSQGDLAVALGITFQQVQKYERGDNRVSASRLVAIAHILGLSAAELLGEGVPLALDHPLALEGAQDLLGRYAHMSLGNRELLLGVARSIAA